MDGSGDEFSQKLQELAPNLPKTLRRIAAFLDQRRADVLSLSAMQLAQALGTSDASVIRTAKALGYDGLPALRRALARSVAPGPAEGFRQTLAESRADADRAARHAVDSHTRQLALFSDAAMARLNAIAGALNESLRIVLFGIGPTAHIVGYGAHLLRRHGRSVLVVDQSGSGLADQLLGLRKGDGVLMFAYGAPYPEIEALLEEAARLSLRTALVTDQPRGRIARLAEQVAHVPRGEAGGMSLHGLTLVWLEALVVALSVMDGARTAAELERLEGLRERIARPGPSP